MSTHELYTIPAEHRTWDVEMEGAARFTWEYDDGRDRLLSLYQKGKDKQWDQTSRIDWSLDVDPNNALGMPVEAISIYGTDQWKKIENDQKAIDELSLHLTSWQFSQFLHGEQGAMICSARIVESVPDLDSKFYAATQTMDEARHAETYARFLQEKVGLLYPINPSLKSLLDDTLSDSRWDMPYLGMQVLIEGLALAAFGLLRDMTTKPLPKQILAYVMQDEARHVAFGRLALKDYYAELTTKEREEREEFVVEGCYLMRDRFRMQEVWANMGLDVDGLPEAVSTRRTSRSTSRCCSAASSRASRTSACGATRSEGLRRHGRARHGRRRPHALMKQDEDIAEQVDAEKAEMARSAVEVERPSSRRHRLTAAAGRASAARAGRVTPGMSRCARNAPREEQSTCSNGRCHAVAERYGSRVGPPRWSGARHRPGEPSRGWWREGRDPSGPHRHPVHRLAPAGAGARRRPGRLDRSGSQWRDRSFRPRVAPPGAPHVVRESS
jgi:hypothetical protein